MELHRVSMELHMNSPKSFMELHRTLLKIPMELHRNSMELYISIFYGEISMEFSCRDANNISTWDTFT
jgi:hypothetical protein